MKDIMEIKFLSCYNSLNKEINSEIKEMKKFYISSKIESQIKEIFQDFAISESDIKKVNRYLFEFNEIQEHLNKLLESTTISAPLLAIIDGDLAVEEALQYNETAMAISEIIVNIEKVKYDLFDDNIVPLEIIEDVLVCSELYQVFGERLIKIDRKKYGFDTAFDMLMAISAYIINEDQIYDGREIDVIDSKNKVYYSYGNHMHGDFRLSMCDLKQQVNEVNPAISKDLLPFSILKNEMVISAYHSVESGFLVALLMVLHKNEISVLDDSESWIEIMENSSGGHILGNYGDAGLNSQGKEEIAFLNFLEGDVGYLGVENSSDYYLPEIVDGDLHYYLYSNSEKVGSPFVINKKIAVEMIKGLFKKASLGNGRTSFDELKSFMDYYLERFETNNKK